MTTGQKSLDARDLRTLFRHGAFGGLTDGQLLERYIARREGAVFEAIVGRHGPTVWGVCRRVLRRHHDAEDAFQATFLVLARKATSVVPRGMVGPWLHGVAYQTAVRARSEVFKRQGRERQVPEMPEPEAAVDEPWDESLSRLDEELSRLPEKYRAPIVLCELEGKTHRQAAELLGWPVGTVSGRLSRGRALLAARLTRRGLAPAGGALAALLSQGSASAGAPAPLVRSTVHAATLSAAAASARVAALTEGVIKTMLMSKIKATTALVAALAAVTLGAAGTRSGDTPRRPDAPGLLNAAPTPAAPGEVIRRKILAAEEEMKTWEGTWAITAGYVCGEEQRKKDAAKGLGRAVIKGGKIRFIMGSNYRPNFSLSVDPSQNPKLIGMIPLNEKLEEDESQPIQLGIYERKGDTLTICLGTDRPDRFDMPPGSGCEVFVLKWAKW